MSSCQGQRLPGSAAVRITSCQGLQLSGSAAFRVNSCQGQQLIASLAHRIESHYRPVVLIVKAPLDWVTHLSWCYGLCSYKRCPKNNLNLHIKSCAECWEKPRYIPLHPPVLDGTDATVHTWHKNQKYTIAPACSGWNGCNGTYLAQEPDIYRCIRFNPIRPFCMQRFRIFLAAYVDTTFVFEQKKTLLLWNCNGKLR